MEATTHTSPRAALVTEATRIQEAFTELIRVIQFRDRDRACCYGLSVSQCHALQAMIRTGPMTVNQLAAHLHLEKSTASRLAKSLLERGLLRKRAPQADGRVVILQVTEAGLRLSRRILNDLTEEYMELLEAFEPGVREAIPQVLEHLTRIITARVTPSGPTCC